MDINKINISKNDYLVCRETGYKFVVNNTWKENGKVIVEATGQAGGGVAETLETWLADGFEVVKLDK